MAALSIKIRAKNDSKKKICSSTFREFMDARHSARVEEDDDDDDDCGEDVAINLEEKDEIWMLGPKVETFI